MDLAELHVFLTVAAERSFSRAAAKLHRTQPAVSQAIRRLEDELGERLFDRSSKQGTLTEAGRVLREYAQRLMRLSEEAETPCASCATCGGDACSSAPTRRPCTRCCRSSARFRSAHPQIQVDVRRVPSRQVGVEVSQGSLDFGVITFQPAERGLASLTIGPDELVMLVHPEPRRWRQRQVTMAEFGRETVIAHNDPSPARERVLRVFEQKHAPINIQIALPSLEAIKRAVEMKMGVALLPKRCALAEISARAADRHAHAAGAAPRQLRLSTAAPATSRTPRRRSSRWRGSITPRRTSADAET
jgi:DNA-binding transcriptional LysR family regulator